MVIKFERAELKNAQEIVQLVNSAYRGNTSRVGWTTEADLLGGVRVSVGDIEESIVQQKDYLLTARIDETLVGCCMVQPHSSTDAYIGMVTILPTLQGQQLGRRLLEKAEQIAASQFRVTHTRMTVISVRTELIAWYKRRGYEDTQLREPFPMHDERFGLPKVSHLDFIVMRKKL